MRPNPLMVTGANYAPDIDLADLLFDSLDVEEPPPLRSSKPTGAAKAKRAKRKRKNIRARSSKR